MNAKAGRSGLIILDRDGVLNSIVIDAEHGTIDSPLNPSQVEVLPTVASALLRLQNMGYKLAICTNQPSAAKGKTTRGNLEAVHAWVLELIEKDGAKIESSHICFHRSEDQCDCRKPKPKLLLEAMAANKISDKATVWMVGDGITDVQAGINAGVKTAFLGPKKCDSCKIFNDLALAPDFWGQSLDEFVAFIESKGSC